MPDAGRYGARLSSFDYIKIKRLNKAKELVTGTSMSVSEISDKTGFSDYNYFLRVFKKHYGISPKKMRKTY